MGYFEEPESDTRLVAMMAGLPKGYRARDEYEENAELVVSLRANLDKACRQIDNFGFRSDEYSGTVDLADCIKELGDDREQLREENRKLVAANSDLGVGLSDATVVNLRLREAAIDVIKRIEEWETAVRKIIGGREIQHGMDLTQLRAALAATEPADAD